MPVKEFTVNSPGLPAELHGGLTQCPRPLPALSLPPTSTDHLPEHTARATRTLAGSPFTVTPVRTGKETLRFESAQKTVSYDIEVRD